MSPERPFAVLIAALGGEGGGVLADWLVDAADSAGFSVQATSIPGVSQRTGATTYYIEIYPVQRSQPGERMPVMGLVPSPGSVDLMIASELVEAGRAIQNGFVTSDTTTLVASTHRIYATAEKMTAYDGRFDQGKLLEAARRFPRRAVLEDFSRLARETGTVINAVLFGAAVGSGVLPVPREHCEEAVRRAGKGAEASLRGFAAGFAAAGGGSLPVSSSSLPSPSAEPVVRVRHEFPAPLHELLDQAVARLTDYQDAAYAQLYLDRLRQVHAVDREAEGESDGFRLTRETARLLALWMCYEDVVRVAELKTRASRFERVRREVGAKPDQPVVVVDYLKPGAQEIASILPPRWAARVRSWAEKRGRPLSNGLKLETSSVRGYLAMRVLVLMKGSRRKSSRYLEEQALMERWLGAIKRLGFAALDRELALEIALCSKLVRGYGETSEKGRKALLNILDTLVENEAAVAKGIPALKQAIRSARETALGNGEAGAAPATSPAAVTVKPLVFMKKRSSA